YYNVFVFFNSYGDHLSLHSFPTLRSSDLMSQLTRRLPLKIRPSLKSLKKVWRTARASPSSRVNLVREKSADVPRRLSCSMMRSRSEEHTSELQSPYDLVCRLLLEKKNDLG